VGCVHLCWVEGNHMASDPNSSDMDSLSALIFFTPLSVICQERAQLIGQRSRSTCRYMSVVFKLLIQEYDIIRSFS